jgi:hypothetical protein
LLHPQSQIRDVQQISRDKLDHPRYATPGFTTSVLDGYGFRGQLLAHPTPWASIPILVRQPVSLLDASCRPHLTATPLGFVARHLHQVGTELSPASCRTCAAYNKKASRMERGFSPHPLSRRVSASTSTGTFLTFGSTSLPIRRQPITVAGPWPIFTAFQSARAG